MKTKNSKSRPTRRMRIPFIVYIALIILVAVSVVSAIGQFWAPFAPAGQDLVNVRQPSSTTHLLGTDSLGRDVLSRVLDGALMTLLGPIVVASGALLVSAPLAILAALRGGWMDATIVRISDTMFALPGLLVIIVVVGLFGGGYWIAVAVMIALIAPHGLRVLRAAALAQVNLPYLESAQIMGVRDSRLMFVHLLPNLGPTLVATLLLDFVSALVSLSALAFLGLGAPPGATDWGTLLSENITLIETNPVSALAPALLLTAVAFAATIAGDWAYGRLEGWEHAHA